MELLVNLLPHVNASLNVVAKLLLITGYVFIRRGRERAHGWTMLCCFVVSAFFLVCYLTYHVSLHALYGQRGKPFTYPGEAVRSIYFAILISHVVLAAAVPFLASASIYYGLRDRRQSHVRIVRWTFPVWLYVSITGVVVYLMLYQIFPGEETELLFRTTGV